jgi:hypothetical protein
MAAHTCNPSYSQHRDQEDLSSRQEVMESPVMVYTCNSSCAGSTDMRSTVHGQLQAEERPYLKII